MTVDDLAGGLNEKQQVDAILFDFWKAFDKVHHQRLLLKLEHYGVLWKPPEVGGRLPLSKSSIGVH